MPISKNVPAFYQKLLDSETYLKHKNQGSSIFLADESYLSDPKRYDLKDPVCMAKVLGDGNCAMRAMALAFLLQGIVQDKQSFVAKKLCEIVEKNKDKVKTSYGIDCPEDFFTYIEQYRSLTPNQCNNFLNIFLDEDEDKEFLYFLSACLRLDISNFCNDNKSSDLILKFGSEKEFDNNLSELKNLKSHVDTAFLHFYLQNDPQVSLHVYQADKGYQSSDQSSYPQEYDRLRAEQSEKLNLNLIFAYHHFDVVMFEKDIDQYFERNKNKCLENQSPAPDEPLIKENIFINRQNKQIVINQDLTQAEDKSTNQSYQNVSKSINDSKEPALESFKSDGSERLDNRLNEARPPSNDSVFNKQEKNKIMNGLSESTFESDSESESEYQLLLDDSKKIKEIEIKPPKKNENQLLKKQLDFLTECLFSHDTAVDEIDQQDAFLYLIKELKDALTDSSSRDSLNYLDKKLLNDARLILKESITSENHLLKHSKNLKKILIEHQKNKLNFYFEQKNSKRLLKRLDLIEGCLSKLYDLNQGEKSALYSLKKCLKAKQVSQSWHDSLDHLNKELLDKAMLILNRTGESEEQLRKDSAELGKIYNEYKEKKLTRSPELFNNKNHDSCRQQENQNGLNTDSVTCPLVY